MPVMRTYRVRVPPAKVQAWQDYERTKGIPMVTARPGCIRAGIARVVEAKDPTFVFFSLWRTRDDLERARASAEWKSVAGAVADLALTVGEDVAEHWDVLALAEATEAPARKH